jgi:glycosyltransferase involved in cell wall biosynthesis
MGRTEDYWLSDVDLKAISAQEGPNENIVNKPLVSVLMLAWNHAEYIDQAVESVVSQQCNFPFELIIGEDCSSDATLSRCRTWQQKYPGIIRIVTSKSNVGMHRNFARMWHRAKVDFVALCEGDDYWVDPAKLQKQMDWFREHPDGSLVGTFTDRVSVTPAGEWVVSGRSAPFEIKELYSLQDLLRSYSFHFSSVMLRKSAVQFPRWFWEVYCVDRPLYLLAAQNGTAGLLPVVTSHYRQHPGGLWSPRSPRAKGEASTDLFRKLEAHLGSPYVETCRQTLAGILWSYMSEAIEAGDWGAARKLYWQALRENPRGLLRGQGGVIPVAGLRVHFPALYQTLRGNRATGAKA